MAFVRGECAEFEYVRTGRSDAVGHGEMAHGC